MESRGKWTSNFGFLMAAITSTVSAAGLGNLWGFPYKMGSYGGCAFLVIYLILGMLCGITMVPIGALVMCLLAFLLVSLTLSFFGI